MKSLKEKFSVPLDELENIFNFHESNDTDGRQIIFLGDQNDTEKSCLNCEVYFNVGDRERIISFADLETAIKVLSSVDPNTVFSVVDGNEQIKLNYSIWLASLKVIARDFWENFTCSESYVQTLIALLSNNEFDAFKDNISMLLNRYK